VNPSLILQLDLSELKVEHKPSGIAPVIKNEGGVDVWRVLEEIEGTPLGLGRVSPVVCKLDDGSIFFCCATCICTLQITGLVGEESISSKV
jgi:hypothetical protein